MISMKVNNLSVKSKIKWKNGQEMANECITAFLQVLCNIDKAVNEQIEDIQIREEFRYKLSDTLIQIADDFQYDNMHEYYTRSSERTESDGEQPING